MKSIIDWSAKRSGGRITIAGTERDSGQPIRVPNVDTIAATPDLHPIATDKDGKRWELIVQMAWKA